MARKSERKGLGRGLSALLADSGPDAVEAPQAATVDGVRTLPIDRIEANPDQPRRHFADQDIDELAASIARNGIIQPLVVRPDLGAADRYQIVAGERRWRAAQRAQVHDVPVVVRDLDDEETLEIAIVENVQRVDLNPVEEAQGYRQLIDRFGRTQDQIAQALGKSRSHIANTLRLLGLPEPVLTHVAAGRLSAGHARALLTVENPAPLAERVMSRGLSVRETEALVRETKAPATPRPAPAAKDADTRAIEGELSAILSMPVRIERTAEGEGGRLSIQFKTLDDLDRLLARLSGL